MPHPGTYRGPSEPEDLDALTTTDKSSRVAAINELKALMDKTDKTVKVDIGLTGPVVIPALPVNSIIIDIKVMVVTVYPGSTVFNIGDHSGSLGALAATSLSDGTGITATSLGSYKLDKYIVPQGDLSVTVTGGNGSTGAAHVLVKYIVGP